MFRFINFAIALLFSVSAFPAQLINGAGATFPYPLYSKWFSEYSKVAKDVRINYQSIGSGAGIKQLLSKTVDFGASDAPMSDKELQSAGVEIVHIPTVLGAVVIGYNLPGVNAGLNLSSDVLADIFMGKIKKWDDKRIQADNPEAKLPSLDITPIYRADGSGTTSVFTDYLSKISSEWKQKVGAGKAVRWLAGLGGKGNEGVSAMLKQVPASIGYVEQAFAITNKIPMAAIKNSAGEFTSPTFDSVAAAANASLPTMPEDFRISITNAPGKGAYPISAFTYILVYKKLPKPTGSEIIKLLNWMVADGQSYAKDLAYSPLPKSLVVKVKSKIATLEP